MKPKKNNHPQKKISLYFNNGAFKKFSGLLNLRDRNFGSFRTLNVGNDYLIDNGMHLTVLPAFHDEVVSRDQSVGLLFTFVCGEEERKIVFTSNSGLFPLRAGIACDYDDDSTKEDLYYFSKENLDNIGKSAYSCKIKAFKQQRRERQGMYFIHNKVSGKEYLCEIPSASECEYRSTRPTK